MENYSGYLGGLGVIMRVLVRGKQMQICLWRKRRVMMEAEIGVTCSDNEKPLAKECRWPLEVGKGKKTNSPF